MRLRPRFVVQLVVLQLAICNVRGWGIKNSKSSFENMQHFKKVTSVASGNVSAPILLGYSTNITYEMQVMSAFDRRIASGGSVPWDSLSSQWKSKFTQLQEAMRIMFHNDQCGSVYNKELKRWYTCCLLEVDNNEPVGFCGSNIALKLPVPCRKPEAKLDFALNGLPSGSQNESAEEPTEANKGEWSCQNENEKRNESFCCYYSPVKGADFCPKCQTKTSSTDWCGQSEQRCKNNCGGTWCNSGSTVLSNSKSVRYSDPTESKRSLTSISRQAESFVLVDEEVFDVIDVTPPSANYCGNAGSSSPCYPLCCDSAYTDTSFCTSAYCF